MVTTQEPQEPQEQDDSIEIIEPAVTDDGTGDAAPGVETPTTESNDQAVPESTETAPPPSDTAQQPASQPESPAAPKQPDMTQQEINELYKRRNEEQDRMWQSKVGKTATGLARRLQEQGYMPEQAQEQARQYVRNEQKFKKQEQETANMLGYQEGKKNAALHYLEANKLADKQTLDDFKALYNAETPEQMEREAKRMKRERELIAENTRLKQGRVSPQSFDNSQGAAEATSNQDRLLEAYINGDRSEAAVKAARRIATGN